MGYDENVFKKVAAHICSLPKFKADFWLDNPHEIIYPAPVPVLAPQKRGVGNAQAPIAAAIAFRILVNRLLNGKPNSVNPTEEEINACVLSLENEIHDISDEDMLHIKASCKDADFEKDLFVAFERK